MATDLRKTGIEVMSQMPWGTHFCLFYETKEDLLDILVPYFKAGLDGNEFCVWVVADPVSEEDAWRALSQAVPAFERHRSNQSIEVLPARDWYLNDGHFELERVTIAWNRKLTQALARGYAGIRVSGDTLWLEKKTWQSFYEYENQLDESITDQPMTVLCTYPLTSSGAAEILDVTRNHQFALARRGGTWEVIETQELKQAKVEIKRLNEQLERRVIERTAELAASNEQLKFQANVLSQVLDVVIAIDNQYRITYWNPAAERLYGFKSDEVLGQRLEQVNHYRWVKPEDEQAANDSLSATGSWRGENIHLKKNGEEIYVESSVSVLKEQSGNTIGLLAIIRDITERRQMEDALRRSEGKFKALFEFAPVGIAVLDRERKIVDMNPVLEQIMRINKEGLLAGAYRSRTYIRPDGTLRPPSEWASERAIHENQPIYGVETGIILEDSQRIWVQVSAVPLGLPDASAVVITQDITERKQAEEALRRSETNYRALAENTLQGIAIYQNQKMVYANPAMFEIFGYTPEELKAMSTEQIIGLTRPDDRRISQERARKRMAGEAVSPEVEVRILRKDGTIRWVQAFNNPIEYNGQPAILSTTLDITERKRAEEEIRRYAAQTEALAEISRTFAEAGLDYQDVLKTVAQRTAELIGDSCVITLFSDNRQRLFPVAFHHPDPKAFALMHDALMHSWQGGTDTQQRYSALLSGESIYMPVVNPEELRALLEPELWLYLETVGISSVLTVPLRLQGQVIGTLGLTRDQPGSPYTLDDHVLLQDVADRAALVIQNAQLFEAVSDHRQQLRVLSARLAEAQETERRAIARELHDEFGQSLTALKMDLAWLNDHLPPRSKSLREKVDSALDLTNETIQMTQRLASQLRPRMLDDLGLAAALEWHVDEWSKRTHIKTKVTLPEEEWELDPSLNTGLYRVCQEALTNVVRHADASKVEVELAREGDEVVLTVRDNGRGMDGGKITAPESLGLLGMKERVEQIGGRLEVQSEAGKGTMVVARVPISQSSSPQPSHPSPKDRRQTGKTSKGRGSHRKKP